MKFRKLNIIKAQMANNNITHLRDISQNGVIISDFNFADNEVDNG